MKWKEAQDVGRRKDRWDGSGREREWKEKKERERTKQRKVYKLLI